MGYGQDMRTSSRSGGLRRALALALLLCACSGGSAEPDAGAAARDAATRDATSPDVGPNDTGIVPDAGEPDAGHLPDAGPTPPGPCTCLHGAHLECGPGQVCLGGYEGDAQTACIRREPRGGAMAGACTSTRTPWSVEAPCSATCVPAEEVRVCRGSGLAVDSHFSRWDVAVRRAITASFEPLINCNQEETECRLDVNDRAQVRGNTSLSEACIQSTAATMLALVEVCAGYDVVAGLGETSPFDVRFRVRDQCARASVESCVSVLTGLFEPSQRGQTSVTRVAGLLAEVCPNGRPTGPCTSSSSIAEASCVVDFLTRAGAAYGR